MLLFCLKFEFNGLVFRVTDSRSGFSHSDGAGTLVMSFRGTRKSIDFYLQGCPFSQKIYHFIILCFELCSLLVIGSLVLWIDYAQFGILRV